MKPRFRHRPPLSLDIGKPDTTQSLRKAAQLELIDQQIRDLDQEIAAADHDREELEKLESSIDDELTVSFLVQERTETVFFTLEDGETCPICGAEPAHHRPSAACDGNIEEIVEAARAKDHAGT